MSDRPDIPMPRYTPVLVASCPHCGADLIDEAFAFWCPACQRAVSFAEVAILDETDYDRD